MKSISYSFVAKQIKDELQQVEQWKELGYDTINSAGEHYKKLEALVELLEVYNCGYVGGYDKGQDRSKRWSLKDRAKFVIERKE